MSILRATVVEVGGRLEVVGFDDKARVVDFGVWHWRVAVGYGNLRRPWYVLWLAERPLFLGPRAINSYHLGEFAEANVSQGGGSMGACQGAERTQ